MKKFKIFTRYDYWGLNDEGTPERVWTKWFKVIPMDYFETENEAKEELKKIMAEEKELSKKTHCKHEYEIREIEIEEEPLIEEKPLKKKSTEKKKRVKK